MNPRSLKALIVAAFATALPACSSSNSDNSDGGPPPVDAAGAVDATDAPAADAGADAPAYPAFPIDAPQIVKNQGTVLEAPVFVTITWTGDPNVGTWEAFDDAIGASSFWSATTSEYGVGPATSGTANHVHMTQSLPASISYTDLQNFVQSTLAGSSADAGVPEGGANDAGPPNPPWPAPTVDAKGNSQTVYTLFIPPSVAVTDPGTGTPFCNEGGLGYHDDVVVANNSIAYSVTLECSNQTLPELEETAAHEAVEAATNPFPESTSLGYVHFDPNHLAWDLFSGFNDELADACQNWADSYVQDTGDFPYWIQRSWSNSAAAAGHDPCVPLQANPYYAVTLLPGQASTVTVDLTSIGGPKSRTPGFAATLGQPLTFQVGYFSDAPASPWPISSFFPAQTQLFTTTGGLLGNGTATVAIDKTTGQNGDVATVTVTTKTKGPAGFHVMAITWDPPPSGSMYLPHYLPIVIVDQ